MKNKKIANNPTFEMFQSIIDNKDKQFFCPHCEEELEETVETDRLYCIKCQITINSSEAKDDVSIDYIFGQ